MHSAAIGGGVGLVAACDIAIASENARFGFSEVKLGLAPAVISPYVVRKIGETHARALFVTGKRFDATHAKAIGLIDMVVPSERLDETLQDTLQELESGAPQAIRSCKMLALAIGKMEVEEARSYTSELIAGMRVSEEGQEGLSAFWRNVTSVANSKVIYKSSSACSLASNHQWLSPRCFGLPFGFFPGCFGCLVGLPFGF